MVDDYDSYTLQVPGSYDLNTIFWNYQGDKIKKFTDEFGDGFREFDLKQKNIISFYSKKLQRVLSELNIFKASIPINKKPKKFVSTFASDCINEVADYIIKDNGADVGMVINLKSNKVSFRRSKNADVDLSKLAGRLADGGGHKYASGATITPQFLSFSKLFKPIK